MIDISQLEVRLQASVSSSHRFYPPESIEKLGEVERAMGPMPPVLRQLLRQFNGAKLFLLPEPLLTLFGASPDPGRSPLEWASDWFVDTYSSRWRQFMQDRSGEWVFAMANYGGLMVMNSSGLVSEWDTGQKMFLSENEVFEAWLDRQLSQCEAVLAELSEEQNHQ